MMLPSSLRPSLRRSRRAPASLAFLAALALPAIPAVPASARAQNPSGADTTHWSGRVAPGHWLRVRDLNGPISVTPSSGDVAEVIAIKRWRRGGDPSSVRIQTTKVGPNGDDVLVCALWGPDATCNEHGYDSGDNEGRGMRRGEVSVEFRVLLPRGVKVAVSSVNGPVRVDSAAAEVDANTVNGEVEVSTSGGPVNAGTVNGSVRASLASVGDARGMRFSTVNGRVIVELPADVNADVDLSTLTGSLHSDYELTVSGRVDPRRIRAHIGKPGGPRIRISTINGSVELRKRQ